MQQLQREADELVRAIETCTDPLLLKKLLGQLEAVNLQITVLITEGKM